MTETSLGSDRKNHGTTRRTLLTAGAFGASLALGTTIGNEVVKPTEGINTKSGVFFPLYERHDNSLPAEQIPNDLDVLYREVSFDANAWDHSGQEVLFALANAEYNPATSMIEPTDTRTETPKAGEKRKFLQPGVLNKLAHNRTRIMLGDILTEDMDNEDMKNGFEATAGVATVIAAHIMGEDRTNVISRVNKKRFDRRSFLTKGAYVAGGALTSAIIPNAIESAILSLYPAIDQRQAVQRIMTRLAGISTDFHPENMVLFFRNTLLADKLLTVAEAIKQEEKKEKPRIGIDAGAEHAGVEDFLVAGADFCRFIISSYPTAVLKKVVEINGGVENFCGSRLLTFPSNFTEKDKNTLLGPKGMNEKQVFDVTLEKILSEKFIKE